MQSHLTHFVVRTFALALLLAAAFAVPGPARAASIGDKTLPLLNGTTKAKLVYSVPGIRNSGDKATSFWCTSTEPIGGADPGP